MLRLSKGMVNQSLIRISLSRHGEILNRARHAVALAIGFHRIDFVVVRRPRHKVLHTHAENGIGMARVQPDWIFRCLAEILWIRTVMDHSVMLGRASRIVGCPPDNRQVTASPFEFWSMRDLDVRGFGSRKAHLRGS